MSRPRYIVVTEYDGGGGEAFGPFYDSDKAEKIADQIRDRSSRYNPGEDAPLGYTEVFSLRLDSWPGIRRFVASADQAEQGLLD